MIGKIGFIVQDFHGCKQGKWHWNLPEFLTNAAVQCCCYYLKINGNRSIHSVLEHQILHISSYAWFVWFSHCRCILYRLFLSIGDQKLFAICRAVAVNGDLIKIQFSIGFEIDRRNCDLPHQITAIVCSHCALPSFPIGFIIVSVWVLGVALCWFLILGIDRLLRDMAGPMTAKDMESHFSPPPWGDEVKPSFLSTLLQESDVWDLFRNINMDKEARLLKVTTWILVVWLLFS